MPMHLSEPIAAAELHQNLYQVLDQVLLTGVPIEVERQGKILRIAAAEPRDRLDNLKARPYLLCDPEEFVGLDWSDSWQP